MTITANPSVRQVLARAVQDPRYAVIAHKPLLSWPHLGLTGLAWGIFVGATVGYLAGPLPLLAAILLNQIALYVAFTPLHDAVHGSASRSLRLNDAIGTVSGTLLLPGVSTTIYRTLHMEHHRWVGDKKRDPDVWFVHAPKPLLPLVCMGPEWIWAYWYATKLWATRCRRERALFVAMLTIYIGVHIGFLVSPWRLDFLLLWLIPHWLAFTVLVYVFAHIQHPQESTWQKAPFQSTVEVRGTRLGKAYWLGQTDHCMHHAMPHIPFHRYHMLWDLSDGILRRQGIPERGLFRGTGPIDLGPTDVGHPGLRATRRTRVLEAPDVGAGRPFDVVLARQGLTLHIPADRQILDVLIQHDIDVSYSCRQGVCGTCITGVLSGDVEHRDAVLSPEVRATNTAMALCVSRAKDATVVLDL